MRLYEFEFCDSFPEKSGARTKEAGVSRKRLRVERMIMMLRAAEDAKLHLITAIA